MLKLPLYSATSIPKRVPCNKYLKSHRTLNLQRGLKMDPFPIQNPVFNVENFQNFTVFKEQNFEKKIQFFLEYSIFWHEIFKFNNSWTAMCQSCPYTKATSILKRVLCSRYLEFLEGSSDRPFSYTNLNIAIFSFPSPPHFVPYTLNRSNRFNVALFLT